MTESIEEVIFPAIGLVFLLLGIVLLASILFSAFNPYDQVAFINAEKLRAKIDEACINQETTISGIELKQNTPAFTWAFSILPKWLIRSGGDPNYVLYYEAFPPGEAVGWETHSDLQSRLIAPVPEDFLESQNPPNSGESVKDYVESIRKYYSQQSADKIDSVIISNIILSKGFRADYRLEKKGDDSSVSWLGGPVDEENREKFFSYGSWGKDTKIPNLYVDGVFTFSNYMSLSPVEKSAIKYMPCGVNSLCLKTRSGVYSFPLRKCNDIKNVQLVYDKRSITSVTDIAAIGGVTVIGAPVISKGLALVAKIPGIGGLLVGIGAEEAFRSLLNGMLSYKESDLAISSPCKISMDPGNDQFDAYSGKIVIEKVRCDNSVKCENLIGYPLYVYDPDSGLLNPVKRGETPVAHYACVEKAGNIGPGSTYTYNELDQCIQITITDIKAEGFCWTLDPYGTDNRITKAAADVMDFAPIVRSLSYLNFNDNPVLVLAPSKPRDLESFVQNWEKKLSWGWPGTT